MRLSELRKRIDMSEFSQLEEKIGYTFKDKSYLRGAMTHSSYSGGKNNGSNERLEFLGDSVLQITVSLYLYTNMTTVPEGGLTKLRASIVCENSLYNFAKRISLGDYILLGKGEEMTGGRERRSILADAFEALIAAIFLDGGMDEAQKFIMRFVPSIEAIKSGKVKLGDYKTILQEIIQQNPEEHISYEVTEEEGEAHHKTFTADVMLNGQSIGTGSGQSKKEAEQAAAKEAIGLMGYETDYHLRRKSRRCLRSRLRTSQSGECRRRSRFSEAASPPSLGSIWSACWSAHMRRYKSTRRSIAGYAAPHARTALTTR